MQTLILDHGSYKCKYGLAGYNKPSNYIKTETLDNIKPIKNGIIQDYDLMVPIWDICFNNNTVPNILISQASSDNTDYIKKIEEIMYEQYNFKNVRILDQHVLSLYNYGRNTGLVVDVGHDRTKIVPVYDNFIISSGVLYSPLAGKCIDKYIDHSIGYVKDYDMYKKNNINKKDLGNVLLDPSLIGYDCPSIAQSIVESIKNTPIDYRRIMYQNIVLVGGSSFIPKLCKKMYNILKENSIGPVKISANRTRHISSWLGGSIVACFSHN